jgi:predicted ATPase
MITHKTLEGFAWIVQRGYAVAEVEAAFGGAAALLEAVGPEPPPQLLPALWGQWVLTLVRGRFNDAEQKSAALLRLAERTGDPGVAMLAHLAQGTSLHGIGRFVEAREHLERAVALHDPAAHGAYRFMYGQDPLMFGKVFLAWALWAMGEPDAAATNVDEAVEHARSLHHPNSEGFALALSALVHHDRGEPDRVMERASALRELSAKQGWLQWTGHALLWSGAALVQTGAVADGLAQIRDGRAIANTVGERSGSSHYDSVLLDALLRAGELEAAAATLASIRAFIAESNEHAFEGEVGRLAGKLAELQGDHAAAASSYRTAIDLALGQGARSYALRAATALASLERRGHATPGPGQPSGRSTLASLLAALSQGHTTADIRSAHEELTHER